MCSNSLGLVTKDQESYCDSTCTGNQNQICGGNFRISIYQIISKKHNFNFNCNNFIYLEINIDLLCPKKGEKYQKISCLINVTLNKVFEYQFTLLIDFGDTETQQFSIKNNFSLQLEKIYNKTGNFKIFLKFKEILLNSSTLIESCFFLLKFFFFNLI